MLLLPREAFLIFTEGRLTKPFEGTDDFVPVERCHLEVIQEFKKIIRRADHARMSPTFLVGNDAYGPQPLSCVLAK
jgi:hypothetical protein